MNKRIQKSPPGFSNFGFSTILLAFVMICIVTISALSLLTANSDYKLSQKVAEKNTAYYVAEKQAYEQLANIDQILANAYDTSSDANTYYQSAETALSAINDSSYDRMTGTFTYIIPIAENQTLEVQLLIQHPTSAEEHYYEIISWKSVYEQIDVEDEILDLID